MGNVDNFADNFDDNFGDDRDNDFVENDEQMIYQQVMLGQTDDDRLFDTALVEQKPADALAILANGGRVDVNGNVRSIAITRLSLAARLGDACLVRKMFEKGAVVTGALSFELLEVAFSLDRDEMIRLFLENGADIDCLDGHGRTLLHDLGQRGYWNWVKKCLSHGARVYVKRPAGTVAPMWDAVLRREFEALESMLTAGKSQLADACRSGDDELFDECRNAADEINLDLLLRALRRCDIPWHRKDMFKVVEILLDRFELAPRRDEDVRSSGLPTHVQYVVAEVAVKYAPFSIVRMLIERRVMPLRFEGKETNGSGLSVLHLALSNGNRDLVYAVLGHEYRSSSRSVVFERVLRAGDDRGVYAILSVDHYILSDDSIANWRQLVAHPSPVSFVVNRHIRLMKAFGQYSGVSTTDGGVFALPIARVETDEFREGALRNVVAESLHRDDIVAYDVLRSCTEQQLQIYANTVPLIANLESHRGDHPYDRLVAQRVYELKSLVR